MVNEPGWIHSSARCWLKLFIPFTGHRDEPLPTARGGIWVTPLFRSDLEYVVIAIVIVMAR
jgi:hypothetical protein